MRNVTTMQMWLVALLALLSPNLAWSAITCTGQSFSFDTPTDPQAQDYTVPSVTNGITFGHFTMRSAARSLTAAPTIGGNTMTQVGSRLAQTSHASELYYRLNVASGVQSVSANFDAAPLSYVLTMVTCGDVKQSAPIAVSNSASAASGTTITVDCAGTTTSQLVLDFAAADTNTTLTVGAGQTSISQAVADGVLVGGSSSEPGGGTVTMSQTITSDDWTTFCVALAKISSRHIAPIGAP